MKATSYSVANKKPWFCFGMGCGPARARESSQRPTGNGK
jgi:hypothetical protein